MTAEDDDAYVAEFARGNRRKAGLRLLGVGVLVAAAGAGVYVYGQKLAAEQAHSAMFVVARRRQSLPVAKLRE